MWGRIFGVGIIASTLCWGGQAQEGRTRSLGFTDWNVTGAATLIPTETGLELPAGAQISRVIASGDSVKMRLRIDATLLEGPADLVSIQIGSSTFAFVREGNHGAVFVSGRERERERERDEFADKPLLTFELGLAEESGVDVTLDALVGEAGSAVRIEAAGRSADWQESGVVDGALEFAISAGGAAPLRISEFEFVVDRPDAAVAENSGNTSSAEPRWTSAGASMVAEREATEVVPALEKNSPPAGPAGANAAKASPEAKNDSPPDRPGLEVFTPPSVRRHVPDANANPRAQEVQS